MTNCSLYESFLINSRLFPLKGSIAKSNITVQWSLVITKVLRAEKMVCANITFGVKLVQSANTGTF